MADTDQSFYTRADAYIHTANAQCDGKTPISGVSDSFMFALSRFNAWVAATDFNAGSEMKAQRQAIIDAHMEQYRAMLEHNVDDHINRFHELMTPPKS